eukprot:1654295-Amphidinium_carterae.1
MKSRFCVRIRSASALQVTKEWPSGCEPEGSFSLVVTQTQDGKGGGQLLQATLSASMCICCFSPVTPNTNAGLSSGGSRG